jgi:hypothetical protein
MLHGPHAIREAGRRDVADPTVAEAIETIYASIKDDNRDLDLHIAALKAAMAREGAKEAVFEPAKLAQNNRQGRKFMQAYFRQKGVTISFTA